MSIGRRSRSSQNGPSVGIVPVTWRTRSLVIFTCAASGNGGQGAFALEPGDQVAGDALAHGPHRLLGAAGDVWGEDDIVEPEQDLRHLRLVMEDIEPGGTQAAVHERLDQGWLVDQPAARDVDEDAPRTQRVDHGAVD